MCVTLFVTSGLQLVYPILLLLTVTPIPANQRTRTRLQRLRLFCLLLLLLRLLPRKIRKVLDILHRVPAKQSSLLLLRRCCRRSLNSRAFAGRFVGLLRRIGNGVQVFQVAVFEGLDSLHGLDQVGMDVDFGSDTFPADFFQSFTLFDDRGWVRVFRCPSMRIVSD